MDAVFTEFVTPDEIRDEEREAMQQALTEYKGLVTSIEQQAHEKLEALNNNHEAMRQVVEWEKTEMQKALETLKNRLKSCAQDYFHRMEMYVSELEAQDLARLEIALAKL